MGFQTNFQQKNIYHTIEKRLINIIEKENLQSIHNYNNFIHPSSNLTKENYNSLLDALNRKFLRIK